MKGFTSVKLVLMRMKSPCSLRSLSTSCIKIGSHLRAQYVPSGISGYMDRHICGKLRILLEQIHVFLAPREDMGNISDRIGESRRVK